jgi:DNA repair photolyase
MTDKINIVNDKGEKVEAVAPVIISASRSTDIPAFYAQWFVNRLKKGYCVWYNPFNQQPVYVSFKNTKVVVFWTKNPSNIIPYLGELDKKGIHYYFQTTLNNYEKERFEPNVPPLKDRIETFKQLSSLIGKEKVIWRYDPLIITNELTPRELLKRIWNVGNQIKGYTEKLIFSFVDVQLYRKVQNNMVKETKIFSKDNVEKAEMNNFQIVELTQGLVKLREYWANERWNLTLSTCAEQIDLDSYGIDHNRCIDGELMERIFSEDKELIYYLHTGKLPQKNIFGNNIEIPSSTKDLKDKGQRKACGCMISKDIGMYNTCRHLCVYCYANTSKKIVLENKSKHSDNSESIIN